MEDIADMQALQNPQLALSNLRGLIIIDEIQLRPELWLRGGFPLSYLAQTQEDSKFLFSNTKT